MRKYVVVDTETTGLDPEEDRLVEIALVGRDGEDHNRGYAGEIRFQESLCNPGRDIPPQAKAVHHILESDVADKPTPAAALAHCIRWMDTGPDTIWVAHNAAFDMGFLKDLDPSLGDRNRWICTYRCAMQIWPDAPGHSNQVLRYWLDVRPELPSDLYPHRALYDTLVTDEILQRMLADHTLADLVDMSHRPITLRKMPFGKHRGVAFRDLPSSYVSWILKQGSQMDADVRHTAMQMVRNPSMI